MRREMVTIGAAALCILLTGCADISQSVQRQPAPTALEDGTDLPRKIPVGVWQGQWTLEHVALDWLHALYERVSPGEKRETVLRLIEGQEKQLSVIQTLYEAIRLPGSSDLSKPAPASNIPERAGEIVREVLDLSDRTITGYEWIAVAFEHHYLKARASSLLEIEREQIRLLNLLKPAP